jgi:hypothetical protein
MSKLTDFYAHKASLQEEGKRIDPQWEQLENQLLQEEEVLPELAEQLRAGDTRGLCPPVTPCDIIPTDLTDILFFTLISQIFFISQISATLSRYLRMFDSRI